MTAERGTHWAQINEFSFVAGMRLASDTLLERMLAWLREDATSAEERSAEDDGPAS